MVTVMIAGAAVFVTGAIVATWCLLRVVDQMTREMQSKLDEMEQVE